MTFPIILGIITLANVESSGWFMTKPERQKKAAADAKFEKSVEAGEIMFEWSRIVKAGLRIAAVGRIIIASMVPGVGYLAEDSYYLHLAPLPRASYFIGYPLRPLVYCKHGRSIIGRGEGVSIDQPSPNPDFSRRRRVHRSVNEPSQGNRAFI
jgi:hypothetical protein